MRLSDKKETLGKHEVSREHKRTQSQVSYRACEEEGVKRGGGEEEKEEAAAHHLISDAWLFGGDLHVLEGEMDLISPNPADS